MKVVELQLAAACKGSPVQVMECAGVPVGDGDKLLVMETIADRMVKQYRGRLVKGQTHEVDKLRHGHYQLITGQGETAAPRSASAKAAPEQKPAEEGQPSDRSMGSSTGEPKRKKKTSRRKKED